MLQFLKNLFGSKKPVTPAAPTVPEPRQPSGPELDQWYTYGRHRYYHGEKMSVVFTNQKKGIRKTIVDGEGYICNFPGIENKEAIAPMIENGSMEPRIRFRTDFDRDGDRIRMLWQIQPDGRYWADDDDFGMEDDIELYLYTYLDEDGNFTGPFRLRRH